MPDLCAPWPRRCDHPQSPGSCAWGDAHSGPPKLGLGSTAAEAPASKAPPLKDPPDRGQPYRHIPRLQCPAPSAVCLKAPRSLDKYASHATDGTDSTPNAAAVAAVTYAQGQLGIPYLWGGNGPNDGGFDCSGLTRAAYQAAGIDLPRTAQTQYEHGPVVPPEAPLEIGDLLYYGTRTNIHHVTIYTGNGQMIAAPGRGQVVKIAPYRWEGDDFFGATRPVK